MSDPQRNAAAAKPRRFEALDGWRGVCAMMVVLFHLNAGTHVYALTRNGYAAVDFFFVLSGFVLMSGFSGKLETRAAVGRFAARRFMRLYPLHLATLAVLIALVGLDALGGNDEAFSGDYNLGGLLQCLTLVQGFTTQALSWNYPSWSISLEFWASLLFGATLWLARSRAWAVFAAYILALGAVALSTHDPGGQAANEAIALGKAAHSFLALFSGALLFKLYAVIARSRRGPPGWLEWPATAVVAAAFLFTGRLPPLGTVVLFAAVILVFAFEAGPVSAWLRRPAPQAAGRWSYSIYLTHPLWTMIVFKAVAAAGDRLGRPAILNDASGDHLVLGGPFAMDLAALGCLALVLATSSLTSRYIEEPGRKLVAKAPRGAINRARDPAGWG